VNLLFFVWVARARRRWLVPVLVVSFAAYACVSHFFGGPNGGWGPNNFVVGFPRVTYHFFVGVMLYRLLPRLGAGLGVLGLPCLLMLLLLFALDLESPLRPGALRHFQLFVVAPMAVLCLSMVRLEGGAARVCRWLGQVSYALYIVHVPVFDLLSLARLSAHVQIAFAIALSIALAWGLSIVDASLRAFLVERRRASRLGSSISVAEES
jgi:peptidoglycan/LPS O-acetylase OafA/YrhL